jgi:anti-sigma B factor antagonist
MDRPDRPVMPLPCDRLPLAGVTRQRTVLSVDGEQDLATCPDLLERVDLAAAETDGDIVLDMSGVTFMDASTVGAIVLASNRLRGASRALRLRSPSSCVQRVLDVCGLCGLIEPAECRRP